jgi:hypothetical protein
MSLAPFADPLWHSRPFGAYYNNSHRKLQKEAREYVDTYLTPFCDEWEKQGAVPPEVTLPAMKHHVVRANQEICKQVIERHSQLGYMAVSVYPLASQYLQGQRLPGGIKPEEWDGFHDLIVIDEIARCGYLGVIWALTCGNSIGAPPLVNFGTAKQKAQFLPDLLSGKTRFCLGVTEPDGQFLLTPEQRHSADSVPSSWIRRCGYHDHGGAARGGVHCGRRKEMDNERHICRLLHRCRSHRWRWAKGCFGIDHSPQSKGRDVQED